MTFYEEIIKQLLSLDNEILKYVIRWWIFCFPKEIENNIKKFVSQKNLEWLLLYLKENKLLNQDLSIKWTIPNDGVVYWHQINQYKIIRDYWKFDVWNAFENFIFSEEDYYKLQILWLVHDFWEYARWDVVYDLKSLENWFDEKKYWLRYTGDLNLQDEIKEKIREIYNIDFDNNHYLKTIFSMYEKMSYLFWAFQTYKTIWTENEILKPFHLIYNVLKNQMYLVINFAKWWKVSMQYYLKDNLENIDNMFKLIEESNFESNNQDDNLKFEVAKVEWKKYKLEFLKTKTI